MAVIIYQDEKGIIDRNVVSTLELANDIVQEKVEALLNNGYRLKRGPEGHMSIYENDSRTIADHHTWFTIEDK